MKRLKAYLLIGYKHGPWKRHGDDWKLRVSWKTQTRLRENRAIIYSGDYSVLCT